MSSIRTQAESTVAQKDWPEDVIARYLTVGGATVDITYASHSGTLVTTCFGCGHYEWTATGSCPHDPPEKEEALIEKALPEIRALAESHTEKCQMPKPTA